VQTLPLKLLEECRRLACRGEEESVGKALALGKMIDAVKTLLLEKTSHQPAAKGLGATVVAGFYVGDGKMAVSHLGDSRAYLLRAGCLERLTEDHTLANMLYQSGHIERSQLASHPARHILTRHIGMADCPPAGTALLPLCSGDRLLFCTDGLTGMLADVEIGRILAGSDFVESACESLIAAANNAGGKDNITAVTVDVLPRPPEKGGSGEVLVRDTIGYSLLPINAGDL